VRPPAADSGHYSTTPDATLDATHPSSLSGVRMGGRGGPCPSVSAIPPEDRRPPVTGEQRGQKRRRGSVSEQSEENRARLAPAPAALRGSPAKAAQQWRRD